MSARPVVTLTLAGAIDATYRVAELRTGAFVRSSAYAREVSGKGVNVAAALRTAGVEAVAVVILGREDAALAERSGSLLHPVFVPGATRVNTSIIDDAGGTTKVNAPAPPLDEAAWSAASAAVLDEIAERDAGWLVISGTVPTVAGAAPDLAGLMRAAGERGARVALDTSGEALARILADPDGLSLVKPNAEELAELTARPLRTIGEVESAARELLARGVEVVYASLGADGVLVVSESTTVRARAQATRVANTAGAGDASLAGFLVGLGGGAGGGTGAGAGGAGAGGGEALAAAAASAAAWGAHAVAQETTLVSSRDGLPVATVDRDPYREEPLSEPAGV